MRLQLRPLRPDEAVTQRLPLAADELVVAAVTRAAGVPVVVEARVAM